MNIKRFFGKSSKEALNMVRKALGDNAVILSNRTINGGNEIMAFKEDEMHALINQEHEESDFVQNTAFIQPHDFAPTHEREYIAPTVSAPLATKSAGMHADMTRFAKRVRQDALEPSFDSVKKVPISKAPISTPNPSNFSNEEDTQNSTQIAVMLKEMRNMRNDIESQLSTFKQSELKPIETMPRVTAPKLQVAKPQAAKPQQSPQMLEMLKEMRNMRSAFESKLTSLTWANIGQQNPVKSGMLSMLLAAGFSASLSRQLAEKLPDNLDGTHAKSWVKNILALNLNTIENEAELFDQGGVFALIGPTGVGKTTTTAKLAARYVMKHGTQNLGIITTDAYRIGGHEQLRIYGKILGVMVYAVKDEADLKIALNELKNKHTILIDTVGVSQRDRMVAEQIAMLSNTNRPIKKLLCINATSTGETLTDVVRAYKGKGLDGCILTKMDEAATIGNALDIVIRNKLKLFYATNGQRVPEDILIANKRALIEQAFKQNAATQWPYQFLNEELPFIMGNSVQQQQPIKSGEVIGYV